MSEDTTIIAPIEAEETIEIPVQRYSAKSVDWEIVDDALRTEKRASRLDVTPLAEALLGGKTIKLPKEYSVNGLYRWAKTHKKTLHRRTFQESQIVWLEDAD